MRYFIFVVYLIYDNFDLTDIIFVVWAKFRLNLLGNAKCAHEESNKSKEKPLVSGFLGSTNIREFRLAEHEESGKLTMTKYRRFFVRETILQTPV